MKRPGLVKPAFICAAIFLCVLFGGLLGIVLGLWAAIVWDVAVIVVALAWLRHRAETAVQHQDSAGSS